MLLFLKFLLAHILGDFVFQPEKWVKDKEEKKSKIGKIILPYWSSCYFIIVLSKI